ncbi:hypothetical protein GLOIN_2v1780678 [Rhizophagus clarus]|uniref:Uncharacterized protein n=1 Tax=Rhizophagus clarus TaxID=94130 RepID=A0A8H3LJB6_9GLOM|nr:hypothetical protein GLOIN_2v1780678 [Rhizophagus clarus]
MLCCETKYTFADKVLYTIMWKEGRAEWMVSSERSASGAKTNRKKSQYSGTHVKFGFDIEVLHQVRIEQFRKLLTGKVIIDKKKRPLNEVQSHQMILESGNPICIYNMELGCENQIINIKYNSIIDNARLDAYVRACDEALLGRDGYRRLTAVEAQLIQLNQQPILDDDDESQDNPDGIVVDEQEIGNENGIYDDNGVHWPIEFIFSSDWKFMYNIMGLNAPTAKYFCLYCDCEASKRWNMDLQWPINENTKCKKKPVLFPAIKQENYIPDELHLMLRISDSKSHSDKWDWTSLMGPNKKKVLQYFPVSNLILERRGKDIEKLWRDFYELYLVLRKPILTNSEIDDFEVKVRLFFGGTTMGGGIKGKSVVHDIMEFENCQLYYLINNTPQEIQMRNINAEDKENKDP